MGLNNISNPFAPVATYTYNSNLEIVVSAVDVDTDTFTCVGHGLSDGDNVYPIMNYGAGAVYPPNVYPGGVEYATYQKYFVGVESVDAFKLYSDAARTSVVDITTNANMDLTKWHFERMNGLSPAITISNLPDMTKLKLKIAGRSIRKGSSAPLLVNNIKRAAEYLKGTGTTGTIYLFPDIVPLGDICVDIEVAVDYTGHLTYRIKGFSVESNTSSAYKSAVINLYLQSPKYYAGTIQSIKLGNFYPANGTTLEVYRA